MASGEGGMLVGSGIEQRRGAAPPARAGAARRLAVAVLAGMAVVTLGSLMMPSPALAWWRGGVWVSGPGYYPYYGRRPYYYAPPIVVPPPPVYYAPPPVVYSAPPPPPVYFPPQPSGYAGVARTCYAPPLVCPMEVPRSPGTTCYCSDPSGNRSYGTAR